MPNVEELLKKLQSPKASVRYDACEELRVTTALPESALAALRTAMLDTDQGVREAAEKALALHQPEPPAVEGEGFHTATREGVNWAKWEYAELEVTIGGPVSGTSGTVCMFQRDGNHHWREGGKPGVMMAQLGEEGWELVAASARIEAGLTSKHKINYIFKRPKEQS